MYKGGLEYTLQPIESQYYVGVWQKPNRLFLTEDLHSGMEKPFNLCIALNYLDDIVTSHPPPPPPPRASFLKRVGETWSVERVDQANI